jgi:Domain of unknown function (DUF6268)
MSINLRKGLLCLLAIFSGASLLGQAQPAAKKKAYCNPLVAGQPSTKTLSLLYEIQPVHSGPTKFPLSLLPVEYTTNSSPAHSIRLNFTRNIVVKPKLYMSISAGYWFSSFNVTNANNNQFATMLQQSRFHSITAGSNIFKPLNEKNFILLNLSLEMNGNNALFKNLSGKNILAGGAAIYGWKKGFTRMWGVGFFRGYRLGKVIHVPAVLYNQSFNKKWGVDALLPARASFRYRASASMLWLMGYELEGTQFAIQNSNTFFNNTFFQRGEIRPRIGLEKQLNKTWAFTANACLRVNGRFDVSSDYNGEKVLTESNPRPSVFINAGIHLISFPKKKGSKK